MRHSMSLADLPFQAVKNKTKTIEMRLFDEKRQSIYVGDEIVFTNVSTKETIKVRVTSTSVYKNFEELYSHCNSVAIGYKPSEIANPKDMLAYYSPQDIEKYGAFAIGIEVM